MRRQETPKRPADSSPQSTSLRSAKKLAQKISKSESEGSSLEEESEVDDVEEIGPEEGEPEPCQ